MATAVKMDEETKSTLEELQAEIKLKTGKKVTHQEILARLVESVSESRSEFIDSFREASVNLSDDEIEQVLDDELGWKKKYRTNGEGSAVSRDTRRRLALRLQTRESAWCGRGAEYGHRVC